MFTKDEYKKFDMPGGTVRKPRDGWLFRDGDT